AGAASPTSPFRRWARAASISPPSSPGCARPATRARCRSSTRPTSSASPSPKRPCWPTASRSSGGSGSDGAANACRRGSLRHPDRGARPAPGRRRCPGASDCRGPARPPALCGRRARRLGCGFVAVSPSIRDYLISLGVAPARVTTILNGITVPDDVPPRATAGMRERLGWSSEHYVVAVVGRLHPVKGHRYLVAALAELSPEFPLLRCLVVGDGSEHDRLQSEIDRRGLHEVVHLTGFRDNVPDLLRESDLMCLPSLSEGMPYALLEAAAIGLPMLASAVGGMAAVLTQDETARLVAP